MSEKVGGAEGTKLDDDFTVMEKARLDYLVFISLIPVLIADT